MSIAESFTLLKHELLDNLVPQLLEQLQTAFRDGRPLHEVERGLWDFALQVGYQSLKAFLDTHGSGDVGATLTMPDGHEVTRLEQRHERRYVSIFGPFTLSRTVYGSREGQALEFVPLDHR